MIATTSIAVLRCAGSPFRPPSTIFYVRPERGGGRAEPVDAHSTFNGVRDAEGRSIWGCTVE